MRVPPAKRTHRVHQVRTLLVGIIRKSVGVGRVEGQEEQQRDQEEEVGCERKHRREEVGRHTDQLTDIKGSEEVLNLLLADAQTEQPACEVDR